jgi:transposase
MHVIGEDRSERLDVIPARYQVIVTRRPKYGCRTCASAMVQAPADRGRPASGWWHTCW